MPPVDAVVVDPGPKTVDLGPLSPSQRETLEDSLDPVPSGAPQAGLGGASTSNGFPAGWTVAGGTFLLLAGLTSFWAWRRRTAR